MTFLRKHWGLFAIGIGLGVIALIVLVGIFSGAGEPTLDVTKQDMVYLYSSKGFFFGSEFEEDGETTVVGRKEGVIITLTGDDGLTSFYLATRDNADAKVTANAVSEAFLEICKSDYGSCMDWIYNAGEQLESETDRIVRTIINDKYIAAGTTPEVVFSLYISPAPKEE